MTLRPHLRVLVTPYCNLNCSFCKPGGEGFFESSEGYMMPAEIEEIIKIGVDIGFRQVKITGGEPLIRSDIVEIIEKLNRIEGIENLNLGTNGLLVKKYIRRLKDGGLTSINISLNTLDDRLYREMTDSPEGVGEVVEGLYACKDNGLHVIINTVVMNQNKREILDLLAMASSVGATIKLMELSNLFNFGYWEKEYISLDEIERILEGRIKGKRVKRPWDGIGIPMGEFMLDDGTKVLSLNPSNGIFYTDDCEKNCPNYPCSDGIFALRVGHSGYLKECFFPVGGPDKSNILGPLRRGKIDDVRSAMSDYFNRLSNAHMRNVWTPELEREKYK